MKILYVNGTWVAGPVVDALHNLGYEVEIYPKREAGLFLQEQVVEEIVNYIVAKNITHIVSICFVYNLAMAAHRTGIKYLSIVWDAPYYKVFTPYGRFKNCYFSVFDKMDYQRFVQGGISNVIYQPLSIDPKAGVQWNNNKRKYFNEISFIGNLYDDSLYDDYMQEIPEVLCKYFDSIFEEAAFKWDGINRLYGKTSKEILAYIQKTCPGFKLINPLEIDDIQYFESYYLARKLANIERLCILNLLAEEYNVTLYTNSTKDIAKLDNVKIMPSVDSIKEAPCIFNGSKINLNVTLSSIERGTPQRVMDIMEAGGFVLSSYCPETAELFVEDREIVMFKSPEELMKKVEYYLSHDEEREKIARAGHEKVFNCYTYEKKLKQFIEWVEGEKR